MVIKVPLEALPSGNQGAGKAVGRVADAAAQHKRLVVGAVADQQPAGGDDHVSPDVGGRLAPAMKSWRERPPGLPTSAPPVDRRKNQCKNWWIGAFKIDLGKGDVLRQQNRLLVQARILVPENGDVAAGDRHLAPEPVGG